MYKYYVFEEQGDYHRWEVFVGLTNDYDFADHLRTNGFTVINVETNEYTIDRSIRFDNVRKEFYQKNPTKEQQIADLEKQLAELKNSDNSDD